MELKDLNSWFMLIANAGVVGGLIFLAYEVQQNTTQLRAESSYSINEALSMMNSAVYNDPILAGILDRGQKDISSLNKTELRQFVSYQFDRINLAIHIQELERDGLTEIHFPYVEFLTKQFRSNPGLQEFLVLVDEEWEGSRELYNRMLVEPETAAFSADSEKLIIEETYNEWVNATNARDIELWSAFLAPNAVFIPPGVKPLKSDTAIRNFYKKSFADPNFSLDCQQLSVDIAQSADMAWARGICKATFTNSGGDKENGTSRWFKIWSRQVGGSWKCQVNIWNYEGHSIEQ